MRKVDFKKVDDDSLNVSKEVFDDLKPKLMPELVRKGEGLLLRGLTGIDPEAEPIKPVEELDSVEAEPKIINPYQPLVQPLEPSPFSKWESSMITTSPYIESVPDFVEAASKIEYIPKPGEEPQEPVISDGEYLEGIVKDEYGKEKVSTDDQITILEAEVKRNKTVIDLLKAKQDGSVRIAKWLAAKAELDSIAEDPYKVAEFIKNDRNITAEDLVDVLLEQKDKVKLIHKVVGLLGGLPERIKNLPHLYSFDLNGTGFVFTEDEVLHLVPYLRQQINELRSETPVDEIGMVKGALKAASELVDKSIEFREQQAEAAEVPTDAINPSHYGYTPGVVNPYEVINIIEHFGLGFCIGNVIKYLLRAGKKEGNSTLQEHKKAKWYLERRIKQLEEEAARNETK